MTELLPVGPAVLVIAVVIERMWAARRRKHLRQHAISETQARANAAPLTTAILGSRRRERTGG
jgi:hypothetical protein